MMPSSRCKRWRRPAAAIRWRPSHRRANTATNASKVIERNFAAGRPEWEPVGVQMVDSVAPYEEAKIRILNGSHSCLAWAGSLTGHKYIHEAVQDPRLRRLATGYVADVIPCLIARGRPTALDLPKYRDEVLLRFSNIHLRDSV
jgi:D-arabinitol 4-dehydrogenase